MKSFLANTGVGGGAAALVIMYFAQGFDDRLKHVEESLVTKVSHAAILGLSERIAEVRINGVNMAVRVSRLEDRDSLSDVLQQLEERRLDRLDRMLEEVREFRYMIDNHAKEKDNGRQ